MISDVAGLAPPCRRGSLVRALFRVGYWRWQGLACGRTLKTPTVFRHSAQGCEARATLGEREVKSSTLKVVASSAYPCGLMQPALGLRNIWALDPA